MQKINLIAFDADDTLWHNETLYLGSIRRFEEILSSYASADVVAGTLDEIEHRNVKIFGYGIKSFTLSMIEAALKIADEEIRGEDIQAILQLPRQMLNTRVELFEHTHAVINALAAEYRLMIITKGDLFEQHLKIEKTGLLEKIPHIEVVAEKNASTYARILQLLKVPADQFLMIGNSLRSDIEPVLQIGAHAVYIPYEHTWTLENNLSGDLPAERYYQLDHLGQLPDLLEEIDTTA